MEVVIVLAVLAVLGFGLFFVLGVFGVFRVAKRNSDRGEQELDVLFDGSDDVSFQITLVSLPFDRVVSGAKARGYRLAHQSAADKYGTQTLMFERTQPAED